MYFYTVILYYANHYNIDFIAPCYNIKISTVVPYVFNGFSQNIGLGNNITTIDSTNNHKWFFSKYSGLATSVSFFKGGSASIFAAPMSIQLNHRLNNNFYAFANIAITPAYISFGPSLMNAGFNKAYPYNSQVNNFGIYQSASLGLMYVNDAKTFSISGSISTERGSYPGALTYYPRNNERQRSNAPVNR